MTNEEFVNHVMHLHAKEFGSTKSRFVLVAASPDGEVCGATNCREDHILPLVACYVSIPGPVKDFNRDKETGELSEVPDGPLQ